MIEKFAKKKGFTLVELLVVIAIIAVLGLLAISGYIQYRKNAILNLASDGLVSFVKEAKSNSIYGVENRDRFAFISQKLEDEELFEYDPEEEPQGKPKCFGLEFERAEDEYSLHKLRYDFVNKRVWDGSEWAYIGCDDETEERESIVLDKNVEIESVESDETEFDYFALRFIPADGVLELKHDGIFVSDFENEFLEVKINYRGSERSYRTVTINLKEKDAPEFDSQ